MSITCQQSQIDGNHHKFKAGIFEEWSVSFKDEIWWIRVYWNERHFWTDTHTFKVLCQVKSFYHWKEEYEENKYDEGKMEIYVLK